MIKPIHKFNSGRMATLCNACRKIITELHTNDLYCNECKSDWVEYKLMEVINKLKEVRK